MLRVLLDTNVLVSMLLPLGRPDATVTRVVAVGVERIDLLLLPEQLLGELRRVVTTSPYAAARVPPDALVDLFTSLRRSADSLPPLAVRPSLTSRDPDDDYLLAHALVGQADDLVSGDKDLLALAGGGFPFRIVSPGEFLTVLEEAGLV